MSRKCFYTNFDYLCGSIPRNSSCFPKIVKELTMACLLYDEVYVQEHALLTHPFAIPAFQELESFVKSGRLRVLTNLNVAEEMGEIKFKDVISAKRYATLHESLTTKYKSLFSILLATPRKKTCAPCIWKMSF